MIAIFAQAQVDADPDWFAKQRTSGAALVLNKRTEERRVDPSIDFMNFDAEQARRRTKRRAPDYLNGYQEEREE